MQKRVEQLSAADQELIRIASEHAKARYAEYFTSIAGALRTKSGEIYTGINLKYGVRNVSACGETRPSTPRSTTAKQNSTPSWASKYFPETDSFEVVNGCGLCRQLFCYNEPLKIIADNQGALEIREAKELLPLPFK